jgi:hypothetical protein
MTFLRNVLRDLIDKKLWPVALLLVVAAVAVPVMLGGGSGSGDDNLADVPAQATKGATGSEKVVSLQDATTGAVSRGGKIRDPFVQHHVPKPIAIAEPASSATPATSTTSSGDSGSATPAPTKPPTPSTSDTGKDPSSSADAADTYSVTLKFGEAGQEKTYKNVARLTPLPSAENPMFVFLGLSEDGESAIFLVDAEAVPSGDGTCHPSEDDCEQVALKAGDSEILELQSGTAGVVDYQLELTSIKQAKASDTATAIAAHARESSAGREYLRKAVADDPSLLDSWDYSKKLGLLVAKTPAQPLASSGGAVARDVLRERGGTLTAR